MGVKRRFHAPALGSAVRFEVFLWFLCAKLFLMREWTGRPSFCVPYCVWPCAAPSMARALVVLS